MLSQLDIRIAINYEKAALVSVERGTGLYSYLLYSEREDQFLVIVYDRVSAIVVTVIPVDYWNNLQSDTIRFGNDKTITTRHMFKAVRAANPCHPILLNPPFCGRESIFLSIRCLESEKIKTIKIGSIAVSDMLQKAKSEMERELRNLLFNAISDSKISESPFYLYWGLSKNVNKTTDKLNLIELSTEMEIRTIFDAIYTDICIRQENTRRYAKHFE
ncbi:hypothetical protein N9762_03830 [Gammaproteobacteria bacterium]|nr:hypothetical protein [Gammaproteobacteria bacterium]